MKANIVLAIAMMGLMLTTAFSGCTGEEKTSQETSGTGVETSGTGENATGDQTLSNQTGENQTHGDYAQTYSDWIDTSSPDGYSMEYTFPVDQGAKTATLEIALSMSEPDSPVPLPVPVTLGYVTVSVKDPAGTEIGTGEVDPVTGETATITINSFSAYGAYKIDVSGYGMSSGGFGYDDGAKYDMKLLVKYS
ncbi:MAG: hypothetical protein PHH26_00930 [Candidatus Thermoplasmatota archaeon]|nr:hypothetical protein [Candidatus Thermoplasmatota archaeon]